MECVVDPFVPHNKLAGFIRMLDDTGGAIVGSAARRLLAAGSLYMRDRLERGYLQWDYSFDLNVLAPSGSYDACVRWFQDQGYVIGHASVEEPYRGAVSEVVRGHIPTPRVDTFKSVAFGATCYSDLRDALRKTMVRD